MLISWGDVILPESLESSDVWWAIGLVISAFVAGWGSHVAIQSAAGLKMITLAQWEALQSLMGGNTAPTSGAQQTDISNEGKVLLKELVAESKGIGDSVAVYPFESNIRRLGISMDSASITIASLQERGFVSLGEELGYNDLEKSETSYPVYRVTKEGFRWAIQNMI